MMEKNPTATGVTIAEEAIRVVWSEGDTSRIPEFYTADFVAHQPRPSLNWTGAPETMDWTGHAGLKAVVNAVRASFPDYTETPELVVADGDLIAMRMRNRGTHTGSPIGRLAASGKRIDVVDTMFVRISNGKIAEQWGLFDEFSVGLQLGLISPHDLPMLGE
ncbi:ester cyclase [Microbacterium alcoholitolerans]|uniref:ester cyclase n=1 Tax=unclassified Microbacterium TaxID=2609290 RepID=UPI003D175956